MEPRTAPRTSIRSAQTSPVTDPPLLINTSLPCSHDLEKGNVMHQKLSISEGAEFDGRVQFIKDASELMPILDAATIASGKANPYETQEVRN
jgi:hypothetical protein